MAAVWKAWCVVGFLCLAGTGCSQGLEPQKDLASRLESASAETEPPLYFLGRSYAGHDLTRVDVEDGEFYYGTCEIVDEGGCSPPAQVQNEEMYLSRPDNVRGCKRLADVRGVPAVSWGGGTVVFLKTSTVTVFTYDMSGDDLGSIAEALRSVSGTTDPTDPLRRPPQRVLNWIDTACGERAGEQGEPIGK